MFGSNLFHCFYLLMLLSSSYGLAIRNRRRIVAGDENLVMSELEKQVSSISFTENKINCAVFVYSAVEVLGVLAVTMCIL